MWRCKISTQIDVNKFGDQRFRQADSDRTKRNSVKLKEGRLRGCKEEILYSEGRGTGTG